MDTVLLTGATGFLGSKLLERLCSEGMHVLVAKRSFSNIRRIENLQGKYIAYDIDKVPLEEVFLKNKISTVIHTATNYGRRGEKLSDVLETNVVFPLKLLEYSLEHGVSTFVNTDTVLPPTLDDYVATKKQFVHYADLMCNGRIRFVNMRLEHIYGPGDDNIKFIPFVLEAMLTGKRSLDLTKGEQRRGFVYINDVVAAYFTVLSSTSSMGMGFHDFQVGSGEVHTISEVVRKAAKITGSDLHLNFGAIPYRKNEVMESKIDISRLESLGWKPMVGLEEGLKLTVEWTRHNEK